MRTTRASSIAKAAVLAAMLTAGGPAAASVMVVESGDSLGGQGQPAVRLGTLGLGTNTIAGTVTSALQGGGSASDRTDLAVVSLPDWLRLVRVDIAASMTDGLGDFFPAVAGRLLIQVLNAEIAAGLGYLPRGTVVLPPQPDVAVGRSLAAGDPLSGEFTLAGDGPGDIYLSAGNLRALNPVQDYVYGYTITLVTAPTPVPEPVSLALLGAGLLGLAAARRQAGARPRGGRYTFPRLASRRRRSAFSRMKPSASSWL